MAYYFITPFSRFNRMVIPNRRGAEKNFFARNRDKLILIVIAALAGSFFTLIGTYLYDNYKDDILDVEGQKSEIGTKGGEVVELTDGTGGNSSSGGTKTAVIVAQVRKTKR